MPLKRAVRAQPFAADFGRWRMCRAAPATWQATTIIGQPFDGSRQTIDPAEAMLDGRHLPVTTVECEDDPQLLAGFPLARE
jgi:hypothetical protein